MKYIEANSYSDPNHQERIICDLNEKKAILLEQGDVYDWHSDSFSFNQRILTNPRKGRYWTQIIYLTEGKPLEIGNWNPLGTLGADFAYPEPSNIIARIYPSPGKTVTFPCFMVHRIVPPVTNRRWTITTFIDSAKYASFTKKDLTKAFKEYFAEDNKLLNTFKKVAKK